MLIVDCDAFTSAWYAREKAVDQHATDIGPALDSWRLEQDRRIPMQKAVINGLKQHVVGTDTHVITLTDEPSQPKIAMKLRASCKDDSAASAALVDLRNRVANVPSFARRMITRIDASAPQVMTLGQFLVLLSQIDAPISRPLACRVFAALAGCASDCDAVTKVPIAVFKHALALLLEAGETT
jgi:hypothetical protein